MIRMCLVTHIKQKVYAIIVVLVCLTIIMGVLLVVYGENLVISVGGTIVNICLTFILLYGVKTQDTTHVLVWLVFSLVETVALVIGISYYAIKAVHMHNIQKTLSNNDSFQSRKMFENILDTGKRYKSFSIIFGCSTIILVPIIYTVKKYYHQIQREEAYQPQNR